MSKIFGGSKSKSQSTQLSYNQAYPQISAAYSPLLGYAGEGAGLLSAFLKGDRSGFDKYLSNTGFNFQRDAGESAIGTSLASKGLRNSGGLLKALLGFNNNLQQQYSDNYINKLLGLTNIGNTAAGLIGEAGQYSTGQSTASSSSTKGFGKFLGQIIGTAAAGSDPRLKTDVILLCREDDGLGLYSYRYKGSDKRWIGVMADEVARLRPKALGPEIAGYKTVYYGRL